MLIMDSFIDIFSMNRRHFKISAVKHLQKKADHEVYCTTFKFLPHTKIEGYCYDCIETQDKGETANETMTLE